jgi:hypothetical protein
MPAQIPGLFSARAAFDENHDQRAFVTTKLAGPWRSMAPVTESPERTEVARFPSSQSTAVARSPSPQITEVTRSPPASHVSTPDPATRAFQELVEQATSAGISLDHLMPELTAWVGRERARPEDQNPEQVDKDLRTAIVTRRSLGYPDRHGAMFISSCFRLLVHNAAKLRRVHLLNVNRSSSIRLEAGEDTTDSTAVVSADQSCSESLYSDTNSEHEREAEPMRNIGFVEAELEVEETEMQFRSTADNMGFAMHLP